MASGVPASHGLYIGGEERPGSKGESRELRDPATLETISTATLASPEDAHHAMEVAEAAYVRSGWAGEDGARRARVLLRIAQKLEESLDAFAGLESLNQGKTLREAKGDIGFVVRTLEYMAGLADKIEGETIPVPGARLDYTVREPLGVTVHIAPWNFPLVLAIRSVAPALAAGNAVVLKPATLTPMTAIAFARLATAAGLPAGLLNVVVGDGREVGEALVLDPRCRAVSFTGSLEVGRRIAELAGRQRVPVSLELGGKGAVVVFADADLDRAARGIAWGIFGNAGQMCWAGSRLLVHEAVHDALLDKIRTLAGGLKVGPGTEAGSEMGPLVSAEQKARVLGFIEEARGIGAVAVHGGSAYPDGPLARGHFLPPTVLDQVPAGARLLREEVFGPVLSVQSFRTFEEGLALANDSSYGLLGSVWSRDLATAHQAARAMEAGMVVVNDAPMTFPQSPFGGRKESGLGTEQGRAALDFFLRHKNVLVNIALPKPPR